MQNIEGIADPKDVFSSYFALHMISFFFLNPFQNISKE